MMCLPDWWWWLLPVMPLKNLVGIQLAAKNKADYAVQCKLQFAAGCVRIVSLLVLMSFFRWCGVFICIEPAAAFARYHYSNCGVY